MPPTCARSVARRVVRCRVRASKCDRGGHEVAPRRDRRRAEFEPWFFRFTAASLARTNELRTPQGRAGGVDLALLSFDVQADLTPAFHWNLKQLFVFVLAEYQTPKNELNQVILWDRIVETEEQAKLDERNIYVKYALIDQANELRNTSINYYLVWDHMPVTGRLFMDKGFGSKKILPKEYF